LTLLHGVKQIIQRKTFVCVLDGMGDRSTVKQGCKRINTGLCDMRIVENTELSFNSLCYLTITMLLVRHVLCSVKTFYCATIELGC
jgi:hypothetical protein